MATHIYLDENLLNQIIPREKTDEGVVWSAPFDVPGEIVKSEAKDGSVVFRFAYPDEELPGPEEAIDEDAHPRVRIRKGRYSGKIMSIRLLPESGTDQVGGIKWVAKRVESQACRMPRKNQQLNHLLIANIISSKAEELVH